MNKAITDGIALTPPRFTSGLDVWSSEDGTPGSKTYDREPDALLVSADPDFSDCLELMKTQSTQKIRYMGEIPLMVGCYLRVSVRVKAVKGPLPSVRVAAWAGGIGGIPVSNVIQTGPAKPLTTLNEIIEISAIIGGGDRTGVDMVWGGEAHYGHFGIDLTGPNGGTIRVDDIRIDDITSVFLRDMMDWVDVRDFGAVGDGTTNDHDAFVAADLAAAGRTVLIPSGQYRIAGNLTFQNNVRFVGSLDMRDDKTLVLRKNFNLNSYRAAFNDNVVGFRKAFQAMMNTADLDNLDLCGRRIALDTPFDMQAAVVNKLNFDKRRIIRNGQFVCKPSKAWTNETSTTTASYSVNNPTQLSKIGDIGSVQVGALVQGNGVGREIYVRAIDVEGKKLTLSQPLYGPDNSQEYTFTRFKYALDLSGFSMLSHLQFTDITIHCGGHSSGILLPPSGSCFHLDTCSIAKPANKCITSHGRGCQDIQIEHCNFLGGDPSPSTNPSKSRALNINANNAKIRDNRFHRFGITSVLNGNGHMFIGNQMVQDGTVADTPQLGAVILTAPHMTSIITGNSFDNCCIEWTNEHDAAPDFSSEFSFGGLTISGNIFTANDVVPLFSWIVIKPFGAGHFIQGLNVQGNTFKSTNGSVDRVEKVDTSNADLDATRARNVIFEGNTFNGVAQATFNPVTLSFTQSANASTWNLNVADYLPFAGNSRSVTSLIAEGNITNSTNQVTHCFPSVVPNAGSANNLVQLNWPQACRGTVVVTARMDKPI